jgi:signal transduction histidine kinase
MRQVLLNLLSNAIKFSRPGGSITLAMRFSDAGEPEISVADGGIGMAPEDIPTALQPFQQIDARLARSHDGTGLGLPLAKMLVEKHGGRLVIESVPERGTTVTVVLPGEWNARLANRSCTWRLPALSSSRCVVARRWPASTPRPCSSAR